MLNPDGVVNGCSRCSLSGTDLNRKYYNAIKRLQPQIVGLKKLA